MEFKSLELEIHTCMCFTALELKIQGLRLLIMQAPHDALAQRASEESLAREERERAYTLRSNGPLKLN